MSFNNLREFLQSLEQARDLARITVPVSRDLEITEVSNRVVKGPQDGNKALLFDNVEGFSIPVVTNLFGSEARMSAALGVTNLEELHHKMGRLVDLKMPRGMRSFLARGMDLVNVLRSVGIGPTKVRAAPCQEVVITDAPDLNMLPVLKCWPKDAGRFITLMQVITRDPLNGTRNVGMYRLQVLNRDRLAMHWQVHKGGAEHGRKAQETGLDKLPAAVVLGGDPASMWVASAPLPADVDEYLLSGWLRKRPVEFVDCVSQPLEVPAQAEIIIEGYVAVEEHATEGPFGDHTGYYTPAEDVPVFHVTAITHRRSPIYPATIVGVPPMEDAIMGKATERLFLPLLRIFLPEIIDYHMPPAGVFHNLVIVKIRKRYAGHPQKVMYGIWGLGLLMLAKAIVIVDDWVDVHNPFEVAWQVLGNVDWDKDMVMVHGPLDDLDHASGRQSFGAKIGIDATAKSLADGRARAWPELVVMTPDVIEKVNAKWKDYGL